jgi:hypothetical protein
MAMDKYAKLELAIRTAFRSFYITKLTSGRQKPLLLPGFEIPRAGAVDLYLAPKAGTTLCLVQRSDYVAAYKHTVGQLTGILAHYYLIDERGLREAVRGSKAHPDQSEIKQNKIEPLKASKRLEEDRKGGKVTIALVTELPDVPQQARELEANFLPIGRMLQTCLSTPIKKKKMCQALDFFTVNTVEDPPKVAPMLDAIKPLLSVKE